MTIIPNQTMADATSPLVGMRQALEALKEQVEQLGVQMAVWDRNGAQIDAVKADDGFCGLVSGAMPEGCQASRDVAGSVLADGQRATIRCGHGCCVIGLPMHQRRRLAGAVTVCYPPRELIEGDHLDNLATTLRLDSQTLRREAKIACLRSQRDAGELTELLGWLLKREYDLHVASDELSKLSSNLASTYEELSLLYRISGSMKVTQSQTEFLQSVCNDLLETMNIQAAAGVIYAYPPARDDEVVLAGSIEMNGDQVRLLAATQIAPRFIKTTRAILDNHFVPAASVNSSEVRSVVAVPLVIDDQPIGMLMGINKQVGEFDSVDLKLLNSIGNQAAVFMSNARLFNDVQDLVMGVLHALTATIDAKDPYTCGHSQRVAMLSREIAKASGFSPAKVQQVYLSGLLHDVGKIGVPESVLCKEGRLTDEEYADIKRHPAIGAKILQGIRQLDEVVIGILTHHERPDGRGYPRGLKGMEVPMEGRIVGLADVFDAMTSDRTYRKALPLTQVIDEIRRCSGTQFDPMLVEKFLAMNIEKLLEDIRRPTGILPML